MSEKESFCVPRRLTKVLKKYPNRVPVIIESKAVPVNKTKYLVPKDVSFSIFMYQLRKHMTVGYWEGVYCYVDNKLIPSTMAMGDIYEEHKSEENTLNITVTKENTFG